jgi:hypothetical protein
MQWWSWIQRGCSKTGGSCERTRAPKTACQGQAYQARRPLRHRCFELALLLLKRVRVMSLVVVRSLTHWRVGAFKPLRLKFHRVGVNG